MRQTLKSKKISKKYSFFLNGHVGGCLVCVGSGRRVKKASLRKCLVAEMWRMGHVRVLGEHTSGRRPGVRTHP